MRLIEQEADYNDVNTIKVVMNQQGDALYMSRQPIPTLAKTGFSATQTYKQVCIIPFRRDVLLQYAQLPPTPLEKLESIDMLRLMEHGYRVRMVETQYNSQAVDTETDLARVAQLMVADPLVSQY